MTVWLLTVLVVGKTFLIELMTLYSKKRLLNRLLSLDLRVVFCSSSGLLWEGVRGMNGISRACSEVGVETKKSDGRYCLYGGELRTGVLLIVVVSRFDDI